MSASRKSVRIKLAVGMLSAAAMVSGCSTGGNDTYYSRSTVPVSYAGGTSSSDALSSSDSSSAAETAATPGETPTGRVEITAQTSTNMVIPLYQESVQVGKRTVDAGAVRLRKKVTTETVNQPVELRTETVTIDRVPATDQSARSLAGSSAAREMAQPFQEGEIVIRLQREEPVVEKQMVPAGNIVAELRPQTEQRTIQSQVRRENIDVSKIGDPQNVTISQNVTAAMANQEAVGGAADTGGQGQGRGASAGEAITDLTTLTATTTPADLAGRQVRLSGVPIQQMMGDRLVAVGMAGSSPIYIRLSEPNSDLSEGTTVNVMGTVTQIPTSMSTLASELGDEAAQALQGQPIYVEAQRVEIAR